MADKKKTSLFAPTTLADVVANRLPVSEARSALVLGRVLTTEHFPPHTGIETTAGICSFAEELLDKHIFICGEIGAGKTTANLQLISEVAEKTTRNIYFVNFKGDDDTNQKVRSLLYPHRGGVPIISIDPDNLKARYNPFKYGDGLSIANRLMRMLGLENMEGNAEHYADLHRSAILLLCLTDTPPRSLGELAIRLTPSWLKGAYPKDHPDRWMADLLTHRDHNDLSPYQKLAVKALPILKQFERFISADGYTFDDGSLIISVPASKIPETAQKFAAILVEDLKHFMSARQKVPCQIFWDEFQAAGNQSITEFLSQARQFQFGAVLSTQDVNKLGSELDQKVLTSDTTTFIAFRTQQSAEFVAKLAGTIERPEVSMHLLEGGIGDEGSVRMQPAWRIDPNRLAQLPDGECYVLKGRAYAKVLVNRITDFPDVPPEPVYPPPPPMPAIEKPALSERS
jgi:hypothetical protein